MENKIKKVFLGRNLIKKNNNPSLIKLNNRYNTKKLPQKKIAKIKVKILTNIFLKILIKQQFIKKIIQK